jgi:hypothetical protein
MSQNEVLQDIISYCPSIAEVDKDTQTVQGTPVSSTNKTDSHVITEILLKVVLNSITLNVTDLLRLV